MLFHTACWTIIYLFIFLCWQIAKHAPRRRHTKRSWEKKREPQRKNHFKKKKIIYLKDTEWRERRLLCRRRWLLQILIQSLRRSLHELHFWSANKLGFFFLFYLAFPPVKIRGEIQVNNMHLFIFLSFFFFFSPFQSVSFSPPPHKLNFSPACTGSSVSFLCRDLACYSLGSSHLICIIRKPCFPRTTALL